MALMADPWQSPTLSPREKLAVAWAEAVTRNRAQVDDELYARLAAEFNTAEVVELTLVIGLFNMINRFNSALAVPLEADDAHPPAVAGPAAAGPAQTADQRQAILARYVSDLGHLLLAQTVPPSPHRSRPQ